MDHSKTIELTIPEGKAVKITCGGVTLWMMQSGRIPSEYQEVEWIAAAANVGAYINLGFAYDTAATIYLDQWLNGAKTTTYPFGAANSTGILRCMLTSPDGESAHTSAFYGSNGVNYGSSSVSNNITNGKNEFVMTIGANVRKLQNLTTGVTSSGAVSQTAYTMTDNLYLFAQNYKGSPRFGGERKISAFKYYDKSNALKCDLVPCYRKADGVIGMYDIARATFLTNAGTGSFTKGADVPTSVGIPEYHFIESARLVDTIRTFKATHPNSLIFGAVSDIHVYNADTTYESRSKTAIKNAAFALEMVGAMAECDFIANLGDNCWENGIDTDNALSGARYSINALKPAFDRLTSFNLVGNHDKSDYTEAQYNLIGVHNDFDVASSTVIRGFGYKDYTDKKVRVIVLNTCDYLNASGGCAMSYEQKDFLMRALDLTEIADKGWQILLLSHIPLDWNGGDYNFYADLQAILKAYENGTTASITVNPSYALNETPSNYETYTGGTLAYDYSGLNSAKIIANIHGHVHTNKVSKVANTDIARVATANTNPDLNKSESYPTYGDYSISTTEAAKIVKVSGTAKDTSATFYCIDLDEQTIYAYGYGADVDRTVIYKDVTIYKVSYALTLCSASNSTKEVVEGASYSTVINPTDTDGEITNVVVTMGGVDITSSCYSNGTISIPNVTGDISITAEAVIPAWSEVITNVAVAIRSVWQVNSGVPALANSNTEAALGVNTANSYSYTDRESKTVYLMPVNAKACDVTVKNTDGSSNTYRFIGLKSNGNTFNTVFSSSKISDNTYAWNAGSIDYILISLEHTDGTSWAWGYNDAQISVTFTNGVTEGGDSGNTPTYTNVIDTVGTEDNVRLRSGGATGSAAGFASNYFPAKGGDIIRVSFPNGNRASIPSNGVYCCTYSDTSGTLVTAYDGSTSSTVLKNVTDTGYEIHIPSSVNCSYARVAGGPNGAYSGWVVTVNEEITI